MNFHQIWEIASAPDDVPIVALLFLIPFYVWYAFRQAFENDRLIDKLSADPKLAKTEHRKTEPWNPKWEKEVHTWPYLLRIELVAAVLVTVLLMVWSITLNAPLEEPSNPNVTMNPAKAPWYFLGLQEMLVYFDPWIAGVIMPTFIFGFIGLWVLMIVIGTFIRGPGWMWFWPGQTWDAQRVEFAVNRNVDQIFGINGSWLVHFMPAANASYAPILARIIFGVFPIALYFIVAGYLVHRMLLLTDFSKKIFKRMTLLQMMTMEVFLI